MRLPAPFLLSALLSFFPLLLVAQEAAPAPEVISLWSGEAPIGDGTFQAETPEITLHRAARPNGAAMVICPGGGYRGQVMEAEGHGIAKWLNQHGIAGVVLKYRLPNGRAMVPLLDAQRALRIVRARSAEWKLDPQRLGIIGFSAGGHLAASAATHFDAGQSASADPIEKVSCRPDFVVLVYPVITMGEKGHAGSRQNLLGPDAAPALIEKFSNEKQVTAQTPPTFMAHAVDDKVVPIEHSEMFLEALQAKKVPAKLLRLPGGGHGLNRYQGPMWDAWQAESLQWIAEQKSNPAGDVPKK